jgi:hypothetical protein
MSNSGPTHYRSFADFEREVIHPHKKCGWSLDDLENEATYNAAPDDSYLENPDRRELNFEM